MTSTHHSTESELPQKSEKQYAEYYEWDELPITDHALFRRIANDVKDNKIASMFMCQSARLLGGDFRVDDEAADQQIRSLINALDDSHWQVQFSAATGLQLVARMDPDVLAALMQPLGEGMSRICCNLRSGLCKNALLTASHLAKGCGRHFTPNFIANVMPILLGRAAGEKRFVADQAMEACKNFCDRKNQCVQETTFSTLASICSEKSKNSQLMAKIAEVLFVAVDTMTCKGRPTEPEDSENVAPGSTAGGLGPPAVASAGGGSRSPRGGSCSNPDCTRHVLTMEMIQMALPMISSLICEKLPAAKSFARRALSGLQQHWECHWTAKGGTTFDEMIHSRMKAAGLQEPQKAALFKGLSDLYHSQKSQTAGSPSCFKLPPSGAGGRVGRLPAVRDGGASSESLKLGAKGRSQSLSCRRGDNIARRAVAADLPSFPAALPSPRPVVPIATEPPVSTSLKDSKIDSPPKEALAAKMKLSSQCVVDSENLPPPANRPNRASVNCPALLPKEAIAHRTSPTTPTAAGDASVSGASRDRESPMSCPATIRRKAFNAEAEPDDHLAVGAMRPVTEGARTATTTAAIVVITPSKTAVVNNSAAKQVDRPTDAPAEVEAIAAVPLNDSPDGGDSPLPHFKPRARPTKETSTATPELPSAVTAYNSSDAPASEPTLLATTAPTPPIREPTTNVVRATAAPKGRARGLPPPLPQAPARVTTKSAALTGISAAFARGAQSSGYGRQRLTPRDDRTQRAMKGQTSGGGFPAARPPLARSHSLNAIRDSSSRARSNSRDQASSGGHTSSAAASRSMAMSLLHKRKPNFAGSNTSPCSTMTGQRSPSSFSTCSVPAARSVRPLRSGSSAVGSARQPLQPSSSRHLPSSSRSGLHPTSRGGAIPPAGLPSAALSRAATHHHFTSSSSTSAVGTKVSSASSTAFGNRSGPPLPSSTTTRGTQNSLRGTAAAHSAADRAARQFPPPPPTSSRIGRSETSSTLIGRRATSQPPAPKKGSGTGGAPRAAPRRRAPPPRPPQAGWRI